jgi:hypothetical protein
MGLGSGSTRRPYHIGLCDNPNSLSGGNVLQNRHQLMISNTTTMFARYGKQRETVSQIEKACLIGFKTKNL